MTGEKKKGTGHFRLRETGAVAITEDDVRIFFDLYRHSILDAHTIRATLPERSPDWLGDRLRKLTDAKFLTRPLQQRKIRRPEGGSYPIAYTLGNMGARYLKENFGLPIRPDRWKTTSDQLSPIHIQHTLEESRFMIHLRMSAERRNDAIGFEYPDQIYARVKPELLKKPRLPTALRTRVDWHGWTEKESTIPDGLCALRYHDAPPEKSSRYLFIEIDRGSETIEPSKRNLTGLSFWRGNSILRKFVVYAGAYREQAHTKIFGIPTFQVLMVTTNPGRVDTMIDALQCHLLQSGQAAPIRYLFTDFETLQAYDHDILAVPLLDGAGKERTLG